MNAASNEQRNQVRGRALSEQLDWPLMRNNITREDVEALAGFLMCGDIPPRGLPWSAWRAANPVPRLTQGPQVAAFEEEFAAWLGAKHAVMVNSGSSANLITMAALRAIRGPGRVLVPAITWISDIAAVLHAGLEPLFVDVDPYTLGMDQSIAAQHEGALAHFVTHCLGFNALTSEDEYRRPLVIEDCCEALGAYHDGRKLGTHGWASNFSFYYAHHMTTIEGGMVCTDDPKLYQCLRMLRSHGLVRESTDAELRADAANACPDLDPQFIFAMPAWNVRSTELNAVLGRSQLARVHVNNGQRSLNLKTFLALLDPAKYRTRYRLYGSSSYALPLVLQEPDEALMGRVLAKLSELGVEYRKGTAGGGNQLRQPYARERWGELYKQFPQAEHIHQYGLYVGNYPDLEQDKIEALTKELNAL